MASVSSSHPPDAAGDRGRRSQGWGYALRDLILSPDRKQRVRIGRSMISMVVYVVCIGMVEYATERGMIDPAPTRALQAGLLGWIIFVYAFLRSGLNERFADPAMTLPQIFGAQTWVTASYMICGPFRGALMMLLALVLVFGIFNLDARGRRLCNMYTVALMGVGMAYMSHISPEMYPANMEVVHFILMATILPVVSVLGAQLSDMRTKLKRQKGDLENALMRIQEMAIRDELTGLYNRRHMIEAIHQQIRRLERSGASFSLCILDLDHFKKVNDTYGHGVGDEVLRGFADVARHTLRETDVIGRWGGEEFLLLLPDTAGDQGLQGVQRMRHTLHEAHVSQSKPELHVTFSAGLTEFRPGESVEQAIERADEALYQAKSRGRDCIRVA